MTPAQKNVARRQAELDTDLFMDLLTWFIKESGHKGYSDVLPPEECPNPVIILQDDDNENNTDQSIDAGVEAGYPYTEDMNGYQQEGLGPMDMTVHRQFTSAEPVEQGETAATATPATNDMSGTTTRPINGPALHPIGFVMDVAIASRYALRNGE